MTTAHSDSVRNGVTVLGVFAFGWAAAGISGLSEQATWWTWAGMAASLGVTVALVQGAGAGRTDLPTTTPLPWRAFRRVVVGEIGTIVVTVAALIALDAVVFIPGAVALVVGVHFFALAKVFHTTLYDLTGSSLCVVALVSLVTATFDGSAGQAVAGLGAAVGLWTTAWALRTGRVPDDRR